MSALKWHQGPMVGFDTESTGVDPTTERIISAAIVFRTPGQRPTDIRWLIDPSVDIPTEASDVHGYTNDRIAQLLAEHGGQLGGALRFHRGHVSPIPADVAIFEIVGQVASAMYREHPLVVHNAAYDCTLLEHEAVRYGVDPVTSRPSGFKGVVDPMVLEKQYDPYRKACYKDPGCDPENRIHTCSGCRGGKWACGGCGSHDRKLESLCRHYRVPHTGAHDAAADALAAIRLAGRLAEAWPDIARRRLATLHEHQVTWRREQQTSLAAFFRKVGKPDEAASCDGGWPLHSSLATRAAA